MEAILLQELDVVIVQCLRHSAGSRKHVMWMIDHVLVDLDFLFPKIECWLGVV